MKEDEDAMPAGPPACARGGARGRERCGARRTAAPTTLAHEAAHGLDECEVPACRSSCGSHRGKIGAVLVRQLAHNVEYAEDGDAGRGASRAVAAAAPAGAQCEARG